MDECQLLLIAGHNVSEAGFAANSIEVVGAGWKRTRTQRSQILPAIRKENIRQVESGENSVFSPLFEVSCLKLRASSDLPSVMKGKESRWNALCDITKGADFSELRVAQSEPSK